ncbi:MAG: HAMP domain-containing protein [Polyangiaceae bacterium]|nr:HAMP domain-containing protein [Polyangiaceae bacterium]MCW5792221.1 HAMP domain-containing protein [Polyangiaceae bacterium]
MTRITSPAPRLAKRRAGVRRSVATRVLLSYTLVTVALTLVTGWGVVAQRRAARDAELIRTGYLPLTLALRDAVHGQDSWNVQLNHITSASNPVDKRVWFETTLKVGRPKAFGGVRQALSLAFTSSEDDSVRKIGERLSQEATEIERSLAPDKEELAQLFESLGRGDAARAEALRDSLVTRGSQGKRRLSDLQTRAERNVDSLLDTARARERVALALAFGLGAFSLLVGLGAALYARRVLRPLGEVTARAKAVADGDLTPRLVAASGDEIGELAQTFENMVQAIARANEQLVSSERLATIGKMAALVTHEIRNPLSSIGLNIELLEEELVGAGEESQALLRAIRGEVERLTALSEQYLSVARQRKAELARESLDDVVTEALGFIRKELERSGIELESEREPGLPMVMLDEGQIRQVLFNLVRNAADALPEGGHLWVRVQRGEPLEAEEEIEAQEEPTPTWVELVIEDDGEGIDEEVRARLFEPFFSTKRQGTGLGLPITRQIIEAHGGTIRVEQRSPSGARFVISLPPAPDEPVT